MVCFIGNIFLFCSVFILFLQVSVCCCLYCIGTLDKKREAPSSQLQGSSQNPAKKPKPGLANAGSFTALGRPALKVADPPSPSSIGNRLEPWEDAAIEVQLTQSNSS